MNKLQLFTTYYITKVERGMDQRRSRGTELPCKLREGLSLLMRSLSRMRSSSGEEQQEIVLKSLREAEVVYHLHGKPIRFEIVLMVSKSSDRKSHSDYVLSI